MGRGRCPGAPGALGGPGGHWVGFGVAARTPGSSPGSPEARERGCWRRGRGCAALPPAHGRLAAGQGISGLHCLTGFLREAVQILLKRSSWCGYHPQASGIQAELREGRGPREADLGSIGHGGHRAAREAGKEGQQARCLKAVGCVKGWGGPQWPTV